MAAPIEPTPVAPPPGYFVDWGKLFTLALVLGFTLTLALVGDISEALVTTVMGAVLGYTFGNGAQARKGSSPAPLFGSNAALPHDDPGEPT